MWHIANCLSNNNKGTTEDRMTKPLPPVFHRCAQTTLLLTHFRCEHVMNDQTLEKLISEILECEDEDARLCISQMALSEMNCTEVYDTLFRYLTILKLHFWNSHFICFPPNLWVASIRILQGVAGHVRCRSVASTPSLFLVEKVFSLLHAQL